jgi:hypothetical protein
VSRRGAGRTEVYYITRNEAKQCNLKYFFTGNPCKHGHVCVRHTSNYDCSECRTLRWNRWYESNKDSYKEKKLEYYNSNKKWINQYNRAYYYKFHSYNLDRQRKWKENNLTKYTAKNRRLASKYRAKKGLATLKNVDTKIMDRVYAECPVGYEVDHVVPLNGKNVCGLHVPWNLQYLPKELNRKKSNRF